MPSKLTRDGAIHLVQRIMRLDYADHAELNDWLDQLEGDLGYPDISELIFAIGPELTAAEVVDAATSYRPVEPRQSPGAWRHRWLSFLVFMPALPFRFRRWSRRMLYSCRAGS
ncbi:MULTISPECIES: hypothetical protein [unclassified Micromonospora]|uniref:hypothetical protein n=1 Tax=unclassified Micromonospora TaxID=2617518 RepID=UPI001C2255DA|nr:MULTISPECIES: hypothetical protein [unclassified Micromonospora]MBU8858107.1 hypothetical protein [Micromonospora sp. WMMB482]MDM4783747.1 hypothetical protein [Micromonospora sp. b486]